VKPSGPSDSATWENARQVRRDSRCWDDHNYQQQFKAARRPDRARADQQGRLSAACAAAPVDDRRGPGRVARAKQRAHRSNRVLAISAVAARPATPTGKRRCAQVGGVQRDRRATSTTGGVNEPNPTRCTVVRGKRAEARPSTLLAGNDYSVSAPPEKSSGAEGAFFCSKGNERRGG